MQLAHNVIGFCVFGHVTKHLLRIVYRSNTTCVQAEELVRAAKADISLHMCKYFGSVECKFVLQSCTIDNL